jgi:hypothetical protein
MEFNGQLHEPIALSLGKSLVYVRAFLFNLKIRSYPVKRIGTADYETALKISKTALLTTDV